MAIRHPHERAPITYARGVKCLDYALGTANVARAVVAAGYGAFNERFISDHRGYFVDLDTKTLFGSPTQDLASPTKRLLKTSNLKHTTSYIENVYDLMIAHNVFERADRLTHAGNCHGFAEALDRDVTAACITAEAKLPLFGEAEWSIELANARKRTHAIGKIFSNMKAGRDVTALIDATKAIMPGNWIPPTSRQQSSQQWRAEKKNAADIAANSIEKRHKALKERIRALDQSNASEGGFW